MCRVSFGVMVLVLGLRKRPYAACFAFVCMVCFWEQSGRSSVLPGLDYRARRPYRYVRIHSTVASLCPARSHTSGTGIHPKEKPQGRREKPRPSYYPQSGGLDETHYQLHQDHQASRQTRLALHATLQVQRSRQIVTSLEGAPSCGATIVCCGMSAGGVGGAPDRASCRTSYRTT